MGHVRVQTKPVWGDTTIYVDGIRRAITGDDGWFVVLGVEPGTRIVEARRDGALTSRGLFEIKAGRVNDVGETLLLLGDVYANDRIDLVDWLIVNAAMGRCIGDPAFQSWTDVNDDGCVTEADLLFVGNNYGRVGPTRWSPIP